MKQTLLTIYMIFFALPSWGSDLQIEINEIFPNQIKVYGVKIIGTEITQRKDIEKAAKILKQWLCLLYTSPSPRDS